MSEAVITVSKMLSSLASPRAAVKYICVAICISLSWKYIGENLGVLGVLDTDIITPIALLIGVGGGSLVGDGIFNLIDRRLKKKLAIKKSLKQEQKRVFEEKERRKRILKNYERTFPHLDDIQKNLLIELTIENMAVDTSHSVVLSLWENSYIEDISNIHSEIYLVRIKPFLVETTRKMWREEIDSNVDRFFNEINPEKEYILQLMESHDHKSMDLLDIDDHGKFFPSMEITESERGYRINFGYLYRNEFEKRTGKKYQDSVFIEIRSLVENEMTSSIE